MAYSPAGIVTPIINTGIFILLYGVLIKIMTGEAYSVTFVAITLTVWIAFLIELGINIILGPSIASLIKVLTKNTDLGFSNDFSSIINDKQLVEKSDK